MMFGSKRKWLGASLVVGVATTIVVPGIGHATNWLMLEATEPAGAPTWAASGFVSLEYQASHDTPLLAGNWRGQPDLFNRFPPRFADGTVAQIPLAGAGAHGSLLDGQLAYRLTVVTGENTIIRNEHGRYGGVIRPIDASITLNRIPHARLRLGLFHQPLGDEATAVEQRHVNLSHVTQQMAQERHFASDGSVNGDPNFDKGPVSAFRDIGVQLLDAFNTGQWEHTYAVMLGRGTGVQPSLNHAGLEKYLYWSSERIFGGKGPQREGLKFYLWGQSGERSLKVGATQVEKDFDRHRAGAGATLRKGRWSLVGEWIEARGMIYHGTDGGAIPGSISNNGALVAGYNVLPESKAHGWYIDAGYRIQESLELRVRYDVLQRGTDSSSTYVQFRGMTFGGSYALTPKTRVIFDYQFRRYNAPQLDSGSPTNVLLGGVDNRIGIRFYQQFNF